MDTSYGINRITPSMLLEYEACPRLFYYRSYLGIQLPQPQVHLKFGTAIHLAIDNIYEQYDKKDKWDLAEISIPKSIFKDNFLISHIDDELDTKGKTKEEFYDGMLKDGLEIIKDFWDKKEELLAKGLNPTEFEIVSKGQVFNPETGEKLPIPVSGRIDGLDKDNSKIIEFKTSSKSYDPHETRNSPQALMYTWFQFCKTGILHSIDYVVMLKNKKSDRIQHIAIEYEMIDLLEFDKRVRSILDKIKNKEFDRPLRGHAPYCDCFKFDELLKLEQKI